jgi:transcriptional regulator with XRE-family HTH domain
MSDRAEARFWFAHRLRAARDLVGFTQAEFAGALTVSRAMIANAESARQYLTPDVMCRVADLTGVTVDWLLGREPFEVRR